MLLEQSFRFRPAEIRDFSRCARNLAWLLRTPLHAAQEILAHAYGYANLHEMQEELKKPGAPGPYFSNDYSDNHVAFHNRLVRLLKSREPPFKSDTDARRYYDADELELCAPPGAHRDAFRKLQGKHQVLSGACDVGRSIRDYACMHLDENQFPEIVFTDLGRAVYDALDSVIPDDGWTENATEGEITEGNIAIEKSIRDLMQDHPNNPWPVTRLLNCFGNLWWQGDWAEEADKDHPDADPCFLTTGPQIARHVARLIAPAEQAFRDLYDAPLETDPVGYRFEDECDFVNLLYWGARIAENVGDQKLAHRRYEELKARFPAEARAFRYNAAAVEIALGIPVRREPFTTGDGELEEDPMAHFTLAVAAYAKGDRQEAAALYGRALGGSWALAEAFNEGLRYRFGFKTLNNVGSPADVQEFMHRTHAFWKSSPGAQHFFTAIATNTDVLAILRECYAVGRQVINTLGEEALTAALAVEQICRAKLCAVVLEAASPPPSG